MIWTFERLKSDNNKPAFGTLDDTLSGTLNKNCVC